MDEPYDQFPIGLDAPHIPGQMTIDEIAGREAAPGEAHGGRRDAGTAAERTAHETVADPGAAPRSVPTKARIRAVVKARINEREHDNTNQTGTRVVS